ncbi:hypothetical protein, partial [Bacillus pseudomycoides]|uniref:hypothetical protein n=1 Tax=Bacillus pseudomycoides TaxID=64104 RepID=UPI002FFF9285
SLIAMGARHMPINLRKQIHPKTEKVNLIIMNKCGVKNVVMGIFRNLIENKKRYCHIPNSVI